MDIILIHGFPFDGSMWQAQVEGLTARGHKVHTPNLPGFGGTPAWPKEHYSIEAFAEVIHQFIQTLGDKPVLGGLSMGGYVVTALMREYPDSVRGIMLIDTRVDVDAPEIKQRRLASIDEVQTSGPENLFQSMLARLVAPKASAELKERVLGIMRRQPVEAIVGGQWAMSRRHDQTDLLPQLAVPALVVVGSEDATTPPAVAMRIHNKIPKSQLVQIAGAGHMAPMEQPHSMNVAIDTYLKTLAS